MNIHDFETQVISLVEKAWPGTQSPTVELANNHIALLCEEVGELARAVRRYGRKRWGHASEKVGTQEDVEDEIGDVLFLLARIAHLCGVDMGQAAQHALEKFERRMVDQ